MHISLIEISHFRGIRTLSWSPGPGINCLIGPGDSSKTTILDAIELALNPRSYLFADDSDFFNLDVSTPVVITVSIGDLPTEFKAENKYGLHLRGWNIDEAEVQDEPGEGLEDILSIRVRIDESLEARWGLYNKRIEAAPDDPPMIRYKDMKTLATSRLGPYAERHLSWGRQSILNQIEESGENVNLRLAQAGRAARDAFRSSGKEVFKATSEKVQGLSADFSVPVKDQYKAELDSQSVSVQAGGISLHDGKLPLRRLGTGSSRLLVSALQHEAASGSHIALIDEIEHGLEPHRIARLLNFLKSAKQEGLKTTQPQIFLTTHSPVVIRELSARDLYTVRSADGLVTVSSAASTPENSKKIQAHLRSSPDAFLAKRVLVGEGRTEAGLVRGLDSWWAENGKPSFAFQGVVPIHGDGKDSGPEIAESLLDLGYEVALLLDSDEEPNADTMKRVQDKGGYIVQWEDHCSTEDRLFLDLPWEAIRKVVAHVASVLGDDAVLAHINNAAQEAALSSIPDLSLPDALDTEDFRRIIGTAAVAKKGSKRQSWLKDIGRAEAVGRLIANDLDAIATKPFATGISKIRDWIDAE